MEELAFVAVSVTVDLFSEPVGLIEQPVSLIFGSVGLEEDAEAIPEAIEELADIDSVGIGFGFIGFG